jgi:hypothetical protein
MTASFRGGDPALVGAGLRKTYQVGRLNIECELLLFEVLREVGGQPEVMEGAETLEVLSTG